MMKRYKGNCHCKEVRFIFYARSAVELIKCNCSICSHTNYIHLIVPHKDFKLIKGKNNLKTYQFNKNLAKHFFCKICGIKSFYQPRSHKNAYSINFNSIHIPKPKIKNIIEFDGINFEKNIKSIII